MENESKKNTVSFPQGNQVGQRRSGESAGKGPTERQTVGSGSPTPPLDDSSSTKFPPAGTKESALSVRSPLPPTDDKAVDLVQVAKDAIQSTVKAVAMQASELTANVADELGATASTQKDRGADVMRGFAKAMSSAAEELKTQSPQVARGIRGAARSVDTLSANLRAQSIANLFKEASDFARRQPTGFFAGAVVAGFALSRFLKSHKPSDGNGGSVGQLSSDSGGGPSPNRNGTSIGSETRSDSGALLATERGGTAAGSGGNSATGFDKGSLGFASGSSSSERSQGASTNANGRSRNGPPLTPNRPTGFKG